jgi:hypothetical protein
MKLYHMPLSNLGDLPKVCHNKCQGYILLLKLKKIFKQLKKTYGTKPGHGQPGPDGPTWTENPGPSWTGLGQKIGPEHRARPGAGRKKRNLSHSRAGLYHVWARLGPNL